MRSRITIDIDAPPDLVFGVVSDPRRWPALLPHYRRVDVLRESGTLRPAAGRELVARYVAVRPILAIVGLSLPVAWTSRFRADPEALELHFRHVGGATAGMVVAWRIRERDAGTRVTLEHELAGPASRRGRPGGEWYAGVIDRWFVRPIAGRTLATFKALCEALPDRWGPAVAAPEAAPPEEAVVADREPVGAR